MASLQNWSAIIANIVTSLGILSFIAIYLSHRQTQEQFKFTVMLSCIDRFQQLMPIIRHDDQDIDRLRKYIDLTNEELFYFQRNYIPKEVIVEWMDSICDFIPIYSKDLKTPLNYSNSAVKIIHDQGLMKGYPRLLKAVILSNRNVSIDDKVLLVEQVAMNLGIQIDKRHFKRASLL